VAGQTIGQYTITSRLGAGGTSEVFLAEDSRLGRKVALKLLDRSLIGNRQMRRRFLREARLASQLDHPNVCAIHEIGEDGRSLFIAMQYVEGKTLKEVIDGRPMNVDSLLSISLQISDALVAAHSLGIVHRDIKSNNVVVTPRGQVKVLDFGLSKVLAEGRDAETELTRPGAVMGTPSYMSPEQARGEPADRRSDIFSFGVVMYEIATGCVPFKGNSIAETLNAVINQPHSSIAETNQKISLALSAVIDRALAKNAANRYQSVEETAAALRNAAGAEGQLEVERLSRTHASFRNTLAGHIHRLLRNRALAACALLAAAMIVALLGWLPRTKQPVAKPQQLLVSTFPGSHTSASFSPDGNRIAFIDAAEAVPQVSVKDVNQETLLRITTGPDGASRPRWSPLGNEIVYVRWSQGRPTIWSVSPQGGALRKVLEGGRNPGWSWDGKRLVFERDYDIWIANADGGDQRKLEGTPSTDLMLADRMPAISPDGSLIAFFQKDKGPIGDYWVIPSSGGQARRLTFDVTHGGAPTWTPDGKYVVCPSHRGGSMTLWKVPISGGEPEPSCRARAKTSILKSHVTVEGSFTRIHGPPIRFVSPTLLRERQRISVIRGTMFSIHPSRQRLTESCSLDWTAAVISRNSWSTPMARLSCK
jgi:eukaryotic-like serine/threonine-protein kinase